MPPQHICLHGAHLSAPAYGTAQNRYLGTRWFGRLCRVTAIGGTSLARSVSGKPGADQSAVRTMEEWPSAPVPPGSDARSSAEA